MAGEDEDEDDDFEDEIDRVNHELDELEDEAEEDDDEDDDEDDGEDSDEEDEAQKPVARSPSLLAAARKARRRKPRSTASKFEKIPEHLIEAVATRPELRLLWAVLSVARRLNRDELQAWAGRVGLPLGAAGPDESLMARLLLYYFEADRVGLRKVTIPTAAELMLARRPVPRELLDHDALVERATQRGIDFGGGVVMNTVLNQTEVRYLERLAKELRLKDVAEVIDFGGDISDRAKHRARAAVLGEMLKPTPPRTPPSTGGVRLRRKGANTRTVRLAGKASTAKSVIPDPWMPVIPTEPALPTPLQAFKAFEPDGVDLGGPGRARYLRDPDLLNRPVRITQAFMKPALVGAGELEGFDVLDAVRRVRALIVGGEIPTGMRLRTSIDDDVASAAVADRGLQAEAVAVLHGEGIGAVEALVEICELTGVTGAEHPDFRLVYKLVGEAYGYPPELPRPAYPMKQARDDQLLREGTIQDIESWTPEARKRRGLFQILRRLQSSVDDLGWVRMPTRSLLDKTDPEALPQVLYRDLLYGANGVAQILKQHVWLELVPGVKGKHASVYWVRYRFDREGAEVLEEDLAARPGWEAEVEQG